MNLKRIGLLIFLIASVSGVIIYLTREGRLATSWVPPPTKTPTILRLRTCKYFDQGLSMEAFRVVTPADWQLQGGITWRNERPLLPASLAFSINSPKMLSGIQCFPDQAYFWVEARGLLIPYDYGPELRQLYAEQYRGYMLSLPMNASDYILEVVIPTYRKNITDLRNLGVISLNDTEVVAQMIKVLEQRPRGPFAEQIEVSASKVHITYVQSGSELEEEIVAIIVIDTLYTTPQQEQETGVRMISTFWTAGPLWSIRTEKGRLTAENAKLLMTIIDSFQWNSEWIQEYSKLLYDLWLKHLQSIMDQHEAVTQAQNEVSKIIQSVFENQEEVMERISEEWSEAIRSVETYDLAPGLNEFTSDGETSVQLPNGFNYAWTNGQGDYILTDSANFDPNVDLQTSYDWKKMEKKL